MSPSLAVALVRFSLFRLIHQDRKPPGTSRDCNDGGNQNQALSHASFPLGTRSPLFVLRDESDTCLSQLRQQAAEEIYDRSIGSGSSQFEELQRLLLETKWYALHSFTRTDWSDICNRGEESPVEAAQAVSDLIITIAQE